MECQVCFSQVKSALECCKAMCFPCIEGYLLGLKEAPTCPFCKKAWDRFFLSKNLSPIFLQKKYRAVEEDLFLERERQKLPRYAILQKSKKLEELAEKMKNDPCYFRYDFRYEIERERPATKRRFALFCKTYKIEETSENFEEFAKMSTHIFKERERLEKSSEKMRDKYRNSNRQSNAERKVERIVRCLDEKCKGVLQDWKCLVCSKKFCSKCREHENGEHKCKKEILQNIQLLEKDTKPCPNCGISISKVDGCDQMYCVYCDVSFYWSTGKINKGAIHNPEYFRKMAKLGIQGRNQANLCDEDPLLGILTNLFIPLQEEFHSVEGWYWATILEMRDAGALNTGKDQTKLEDAAVDYLNSKIDEKEWKRRIYCAYKGFDYVSGFTRLGTLYYELTVNVYLTTGAKKLDVFADLIHDFYQDLMQWSKFTGRALPDIIPAARIFASY